MDLVMNLRQTCAILTTEKLRNMRSCQIPTPTDPSKLEMWCNCYHNYMCHKDIVFMSSYCQAG